MDFNLKSIFKKYKEIKLISKLLNFFALLILLSIVLNVFMLNFTVTFLFMGLCIFLIILPNLLYPVFIIDFLINIGQQGKWQDYLNNFLFILSVIIALILIVFIFFNINSSTEKLPVDNQNLTIIVLGSGIKNGKPMSNLKKRLEAAGSYLEENNSVNCIVSGGLNRAENLIEADVMENYLVKNYSIEEGRIEKESASTDTYQNLKYSKEIITEKNLSENILIITNDFHMFRSVLFSNALDYDNVYTLPVKTNPILLTTFWFREILSMIKAVILVRWPSLFGY